MALLALETYQRVFSSQSSVYHNIVSKIRKTSQEIIFPISQKLH